MIIALVPDSKSEEELALARGRPARLGKPAALPNLLMFANPMYEANLCLIS
jgi:hypothetical protein